MSFPEDRGILRWVRLLRLMVPSAEDLTAGFPWGIWFTVFEEFQLPLTIRLSVQGEDAAADAAEHGTWTEPGAIAQRDGAAYYRIGETSGIVATHTVRLVVVESSALRAKADARIAQDLETAAKRVDNAAKRLGRQRFASEAEAHQALESWK